jgi:tetrahydrodipicolinate N-succinyltransferase
MITLTQNEEKIVTKIRQLSSDQLQNLEKLIDQLSQASDSTEKTHPWLEFAGIFKDDPSFDQFLQEMENYRKEVDAQAEEEYLLEETKAA